MHVKPKQMQNSVDSRSVHQPTSNYQNKHNQNNQILNSVTEGAASLWKIASNTAKATVQHLSNVTPLFGNINIPLSDMSESNLAQLSDELETIFNDTDPNHEQLLLDLWKVQFPIQTYKRKSLQWKDAGWQTEDPVSDLKSSGVLAIHALTYFGNKFSEMSLDRLNANKANIKTNYPYSIVGINLTLLLADLLSLKDNK